MQLFDEPDPSRRVLIAGTYNAHPVSTAAAITTLQILSDNEVYQHMERLCTRLYSGLETMFTDRVMPMVLSRNASAFCMYFCSKSPKDLHDILMYHNFDFDLKLRKALIKKGIYNIPIACKQSSVSFAHTEEDIDKTLAATRAV